MGKTLLTVPCPFCGHILISKVVQDATWSIAACAKCTNAWSVPQPKASIETAQDFHGQFDYRKLSDLSIQWRSAILKQTSLLTTRLKPGALVLEIGCGRGIVLHELKRRGYKVQGVEISPFAAEEAQKSGIDIQCGDFMNINLICKYDAIFLSHVLEHVADIVPFLEKIKNALVPGGVVVFAQSNWKGLIARLQGRRWYAWVPDQHYWHFTPKGLQMILNQHGWNVLAIEHSSLSHGNSILSRLGPVIRMGDQFHLLAIK